MPEYNYTNNSTVNATNTTTNQTHHTKHQDEDEFETYTKWVMDNYDVNKDGYLDPKEAKKMLDDAMKLDVPFSDVEVWVNKFDINKDGRLSIGEIAQALEEL
jgi:Ca2+-binding EF-hand superfamily protein